MTASSRAEVVVVGAGPVGLLAACELARRGIAIRVIDMLSRPTTESRAIVVHARSLEMLDRVGVLPAIIDSGVKTTAMQMFSGGRRLANVDLAHIDAAFPYAVTTPQTETERILGERLQSLGVTVERGVELIALTQDADTAHLTVRHPDATTELIDAAWVVGTDGAHSRVRALVGTRLNGSFRGERFMMGDVEAEHELDESSIYSYFAADGPLLVFPMRGQRMRLIAQIHDPADQPLNLNPTQAELQEIVDVRAGGIRITASHWLTGFEVHHAQVPAYRFGRAFLAGDAAHVHSPAGGQGMNTGMQDSFNLAWKLALAVQGQGGEQLLDSYHAERHPVAAGVIKFSTALTRVGTVQGSLPIKLRNQVMHAVAGFAPTRQAMADTTAEVTVSYGHSPVVIRQHRWHAKVAAGDQMPAIDDPELSRQLRAAGAFDSLGHVVLTIAGKAEIPAPIAKDGARSILIADSSATHPDYDAVVADPTHTIAGRYGLLDGGRVVIRPDGYLGQIIGPKGDVSEYFALLI
jgi:2-polyprenyl-6-methoxyphenol hydroxylase-like FAD-dependent oxidoreductase